MSSTRNLTLTGRIRVDGSSTVYPITEAVAEEFGKDNKNVRVTVGVSGTGGGFKKFGMGEIDVAGASRPIKGVESALCSDNGIEFIELPVAYDALSVVVSPKNTWCKSLTVSELESLWEPVAQRKVMYWSQIRSTFPRSPIRLFGPGTDSGTFDYFTKVVCGKEGASRGDYTASEDDNVLVHGITRDQYALGYFGAAYYSENQDILKAVSIDDENDENGKGPQLPNSENVINGIYQPLSRPIFIYVSRGAADRPEVAAFINFYLANAPELAKEVGYVPFTDRIYQLVRERFEQQIVGSIFTAERSQGDVTLEELLVLQ